MVPAPPPTEGLLRVHLASRHNGICLRPTLQDGVRTIRLPTRTTKIDQSVEQEHCGDKLNDFDGFTYGEPPPPWK
jgi:hypothetical protein